MPTSTTNGGGGGGGNSLVVVAAKMKMSNATAKTQRSRGWTVIWKEDLCVGLREVSTISSSVAGSRSVVFASLPKAWKVKAKNEPKPGMAEIPAVWA